MSSQTSTESIIKQLCAGLLSGGAIGICISRSQYLLSYLTFTSIGLADLAYHMNYLKAHITHLTYDSLTTRANLRSTLNSFQRSIQRELRDPQEDLNQELQWLWNDIRRHVDGHIYFGMGFTMAFLISVALLPKGRR